MELKSDDGALLELKLVNYQFPFACSTDGTRDWDANWLVVRGSVVLPDGRSWGFQDPFLTTWEAHEIIRWMRKVCAGTVKPSPLQLPDGLLAVKSRHGLYFLEPNLAFSLEAHYAHQIRLRIHFSLELCPPWLGPSTPTFEYFVVFHVEEEQLLQVAAQWETELLRFPVR